MTRKIFLLVFLILLIQVPVTALAEKDQEAIISDVQGEASIIREGVSLPAAAGMPCRKNDTLKTGADSRLDVAFQGLAGCRLLSESEVILESADKTLMQVQVKSGNVIMNLKKLPEHSSFKVDTPIAVAAVRGTQFWGQVRPEKESPKTTFAVREGSVEITAKVSGRQFTLNEGEALDIPADASIPSVRAAKTEEMQAMAQAPEVKTGVDV